MDEGGGGEAATTTRNEGPQVALTLRGLQETETETETDWAPTKRLEGADPVTVQVSPLLLNLDDSCTGSEVVSSTVTCSRSLLRFAGFNHAGVVDFIAKVSCKAAGGEKKVGDEGFRWKV